MDPGLSSGVEEATDDIAKKQGNISDELFEVVSRLKTCSVPLSGPLEKLISEM